MAHAEDLAPPMPSPPLSSTLRMSGRPPRNTIGKRKGRQAAVQTAQPSAPPSAEHHVFDEMPTSVVGDGSFMSMMVDDDVEVVMDEEGFIDPSPSKGRQMNYTIQEDETLVLAWEAITLDAIHGVEQSGSTYWQRIHEHYHQIKKTPGDRTQKSLTNRSAIQDTCSKWASAMEQVERLNPSGANQNDRINIAQKYFRQLTSKNGKIGKPFNLQPCYSLLVHDEKWRTRNDEMPNKKSKSTSNSSSPDVETIGENSDESDSDDAKRSPTPNSVEKKRPLGRKKEKARLKKEEGTYKDSIDMVVATRKSLAAERKEEKAQTFMQIKEMEERRIAFEARRVQLEEHRIAIEERREKQKQEKNEHQLMFMNSSNLDDQGKAYLKLMRDQIMVSKTMGGFMSGFYMGAGGSMGGGGGMGDGGGAMGDGGNMGGGGGMGDGGGAMGDGGNMGDGGGMGDGGNMGGGTSG